MARKTRNPGAGRRQGFDLELVSHAGSEIEDNRTARFPQSLAAHRIARRFGLPPATAAAVAQLAGIGGAHA